MSLVDKSVIVIRLWAEWSGVRFPAAANIALLVTLFKPYLGHVARMGEERGAYRVLVGKPEGKRLLGRPRR